MDYNTEDKPRVQIPIRINSSLYEKFNTISKKTRIPKSILARDAIERHMTDIENRGITAVLNDLENELTV